MGSADWVLSLVGLALVSLVGILLFIEIVVALRRIDHDRESRRRSLELLDEQIKAAKALKVRNESARLAWNGYRKFVVDRKVDEAEGVCSFYLVPHDRKKLPAYRPGQFLTFRLSIPGHEKPVIRCYSLSDVGDDRQWRVTIKRVPSPRDQPDVPRGLVSNYFQDEVHEGDILDVKSPSGNFVLDPFKSKPVVLIAGGIGITPMLSMARAVEQSETTRQIWLFYGVRHRGEHVLKDQLGQLSKGHSNIRIVTCYSNPNSDDCQGQDYDHAERVSVDLVKRYVDSNNFDFYMCGPPAMMQSLTKQLAEWGVPKCDIFTEAFGPASVKAKKQVDLETEPQPAVAACKVQYAKSAKEFAWDPSADNLLEFSESKGIYLEGGCRAGNCGTCELALVSGEIDYVQHPEFSELKDGCCLTCIGIPKGDIILDA